jgi:DNA-binding CsgD family transcriptional regulator/tetratricopeptide (TPR) repeat protein
MLGTRHPRVATCTGHVDDGHAVQLFERSSQLSLLEQRLAEVRARAGGRLVLVGGEAGIGKTALLRSFCDGLSLRVVWVACEPLFAPRPLGPLLDAAHVTGGELAERVGGGAKPHDVALSLMDELRAGAPTVLVLEDLHWADEATLDVVRLLARRVETVPALVLATYRDDELDRSHPLRIVLGDLPSRGAVTRLALDALSRDTVATLAAESPLNPDDLYERTGGNPFYVTEVLAARTERTPETVRDAVLARAARLSPAARALLDAVAIVPQPAELWLLDRLVESPAGTLHECLRSGMLRADGGLVAFRHELARIAVEDSLPPDDRLALHGRALAALAEPPSGTADLARVSHHAEAAGDRDAVLRFAPAAAEQAAASGAHREAAAQLARALSCADGAPLDVRAQLLERRAHECYVCAQLDAAIDAQREALECRRRLGDRLGEGNAERSLSRLLFFTGRPDEGERRALHAVDLLEGLEPGHELAMAYANVSQRRMVVEEHEAAIEWGGRAVELAERFGDTEVLVYALTNIGCAQARAGALEDGCEQLERVLDLALRHGMEEYAGRAFSSLVLLPLGDRRFDLARQHLDAGLEYCTQRGLDMWRLYLLAEDALLQLATGRYDEATDAASRVLQDPRSAAVARGWAETALTLVRARRGGTPDTLLLDEEQARSDATAELMRMAPVAAARAEIAWLAGDTSLVAGVTDSALGLALERNAPWAAGALVYWRWRAGLRDELRTDTIAEPYRLAIDGQWSSASRLWREIGCPYEAALALLGSDYEVDMRRAFDELRALGADAAAAMAARELRARGVRGIPRGPRPRTRENKAGLTARELDVVACLADGLRNADIAERLVLSPKTVDHHVSAILRKLDARTRGEAAAEAARLGLVRSG